MSPSASSIHLHRPRSKNSIPVHHDFDVELIRQTLEEVLTESLNKVVRKEQQRFNTYMEERVDGLRPEIEALFLDRALKNESYWRSVETVISQHADMMEEELGPAIEAMKEEGRKSNLSTRDQLAILIVRCLRNNLAKRADFMSELIFRRFITFFEADDKGVPFYWAGLTQDKITSIYVAARDEADSEYFHITPSSQRPAELMPILNCFELNLSHVLSEDAEIQESDLREFRLSGPANVYLLLRRLFDATIHSSESGRNQQDRCTKNVEGMPRGAVHTSQRRQDHHPCLVVVSSTVPWSGDHSLTGGS